MSQYKIIRHYPQSNNDMLMSWCKTHDEFIINADYYTKEGDFFNFYEEDPDTGGKELVSSFPSDRNTIVVKTLNNN